MGLLCLGLTVTPPPSGALADEIDRLVEQDPCVGAIERWPARYYIWERASWARQRDLRYLLWGLSGPWLGSDRSKVNVQLYQGAWAGDYPPGRHRLRADQERLWLDSSNFMNAGGTYDVGARRMIDWRCGPNSG